MSISTVPEFFDRRGGSPVTPGPSVQFLEPFHGESAEYNDIVSWDWTAIPAALGVGTEPIVRRVTTVGELRDALNDAAAQRDRMVVIEAVVPRMDVPPLLTQLATAASAANKS